METNLNIEKFVKKDYLVLGTKREFCQAFSELKKYLLPERRNTLMRTVLPHA
jgi:hypothetical protein